MSGSDTGHVSREKRSLLPDSFGSECPVCGEPFDAGSSGIVFTDGGVVDVRSWVRICQTEPPSDEWFQVSETDKQLPFMYVHKDEHIHE